MGTTAHQDFGSQNFDATLVKSVSGFTTGTHASVRQRFADIHQVVVTRHAQLWGLGRKAYDPSGTATGLMYVALSPDGRPAGYQAEKHSDTPPPRGGGRHLPCHKTDIKVLNAC